MAIDRHDAEFLLHAKEKGIAFEKCMTIGRQNLALDDALLGFYGERLSFSVKELRQLHPDKRYADSFLHALGAKEAHSLDFSDYEGCTHCIDMNAPVPDKLAGRYDIVFDGGSLEHIFNFPQAVRNCIELVRPGGHFFSHTPCDNLMGHGFYQFSPELFFRILSKENGFEPPTVILIESDGRGRRYLVSDPAATGLRTGSLGRGPVTMLVMARRIAAVALFQNPPQQSDYSSRWDQSPGVDTAGGKSPAGFLRSAIGRVLPEILVRPLRLHLIRRRHRREAAAGLREIRTFDEI